MKSSIAALRAITGVYLRRLSLWGGGIVLAVTGLVGAGIIYLAISDSGWWWLFILPVALLAGVGVVIWFVVRFAARRLLPRQLTKTERRQILSFTDKLFAQAASLQISRAAIIFMLIKDVLTGNSPQNRFRNIIEDGKTTKSDFEGIRRLFEE